MSVKKSSTEETKVKQDSFLVGFVAGATASSIAETTTIPLDTAKVRMMLYGMSGDYATVTSTLKTIIKDQGAPRLFKGLAPAILRQCVFSGIKLSLYEPIRNALCKDEAEMKNTPLIKQIISGIIGGGIACYFASPFDLVKIRMQDANKSKAYKGTFDCFGQIYAKEGGIKGYFNGVWPNVGRNAVMNAAELSAFDTTRQLVLNHTNLPDHPALYLLYGTSAGVVGSLVAQPVDLVKTRVMNNPEIYKNALVCIKLTIQKDGPLSFYNGIKPFMVRACSFNQVMFLFYGYCREFYRKALDSE